MVLRRPVRVVGIISRYQKPKQAVHHRIDLNSSQSLRCVATYSYPHQSAAISVLPSSVDTSSVEFKENARQMGDVMAKLEELHSRIACGGPQKALDKHVARKKMLPREYVFVLLCRAVELIVFLVAVLLP